MQPVFRQQRKPFYPFHPPPDQFQNPFLFHRPNMSPGTIGRGGWLRNLFSFNRPNALNHPVHPFQMNRMIPTQTPSAGQNIWNLDRITRFLNQTQQVLNTAQQIGPMVQQYGPLIRNLPTLWKLYKAVNSEKKEEDPSDQSVEQNLESKEKERETKKKLTESHLTEQKNSMENRANKRKKEKKKDEPKPSVPKLYI